MINIKTLELRVVREKSMMYDFESNRLNSPSEAYDMIEAVFHLSDLAEEKLVMLAVNTKHEVVGAFSVSHGDLSTSIMNPREILKRALLVNASGFFLAHNHPSGDLAPSSEDISATARLKEACKIMGVDFIDHLIVGNYQYLSLREKALF